jgi:hypothetical protein
LPHQPDSGAASSARSKDMSDPTDEQVQFDAIIAQYCASWYD